MKPELSEVCSMPSLTNLPRLFISLAILFLLSGAVAAQRGIASMGGESNESFGPVMQAYLGYLNNEQEVVDDRASRKEITAAYYRRNVGRIRALRQMAIRLVRQSGNDYVPELEAVTQDELRTLFENPPKAAAFRPNEIIGNKFRFLAPVHSAEVFYLFARLDPYEQAELMERQKKDSPTSVAGSGSAMASGQRVGQTSTRPRRTSPK
jgi:hypothetical protein